MPALTRRSFLGSSAAVTGASLAAGTIAAGMPLAAAATSGGAKPAYGPAAGVAKLNANENPYGPSPAAIKEAFEATRLGAYYVGASVPMLKSMIAERHGVDPEYIALSSGSSGVLTYIATAAGTKGSILAPDLFWDTTARMGTAPLLPPS